MLTAAALLGIAAKTTELAVAYASEREQFGKPIGSFQAVKHLCADMLTRAELARGAVYAAGVTLDGRGVDDPDRMVAAAKITAGDAAKANGKACIQVHGGMGFTWEVDAHLYLKRAIVPRHLVRLRRRPQRGSARCDICVASLRSATPAPPMRRSSALLRSDCAARDLRRDRGQPRSERRGLRCGPRGGPRRRRRPSR